MGAKEDIWTYEAKSNRRLEKVHNEKFNNLYSSPDFIRVIISKGMRWAEHTEHTGEKEMHTEIWEEDLK
jgi:acyl-coenzyme A synthetase/AMP-(fatty) acid ligase